METICLKCAFLFDDEAEGIETEYQTYSNGVKHLKALCPECRTRQSRAIPQTLTEVYAFMRDRGYTRGTGTWSEHEGAKAIFLKDKTVSLEMYHKIVNWIAAYLGL